jgi:hypothetical protein
MRSFLLLLSAILAGACHDRSHNSPLPDAGATTWQIHDSTVQFHTYTSAGLLDSTFKTDYLFRRGKVVLDIRTLITRQYDKKGKLTEEQSFNYLDRSKTWDPESRTTKKYDPKGNLILDIAFDIKNAKSTIYTLKKRIYNLNNQEIIRFEIHQQLETSKYDTFIISSTYDENGHRVTETYGRPGIPTEEVLFSTYAQGLKTMTYSMNANGDTNNIYRYDKEGGLTRRTTQHKKKSIYDGIDTTWYEGDRIVKWVHYNNKPHNREMCVYQYDAKGNEVRKISYN